jgi:hypothetical protein
VSYPASRSVKDTEPAPAAQYPAFAPLDGSGRLAA